LYRRTRRVTAETVGSRPGRAVEEERLRQEEEAAAQAADAAQWD
jgi:hypothetical protein